MYSPLISAVIGRHRHHFLIGIDRRDQRPGIAIEAREARRVVDEQKAAGVQMPPQCLHFFGAEGRVVHAGHQHDRRIGQLLDIGVDRLDGEVDRNRRAIVGQANQLIEAVGIGVPVALMAQVSDRDRRPTLGLLAQNLARVGLGHGKAAIGRDVADDVHAQPDRIVGHDGLRGRGLDVAGARGRGSEKLVPAAGHVVGRIDHGGPGGDVQPQQYRRALALGVHPFGRLKIMDVAVGIVRPQDRMIERQRVETAVGKDGLHFAGERSGELLAAQRGRCPTACRRRPGRLAGRPVARA